MVGPVFRVKGKETVFPFFVHSNGTGFSLTGFPTTKGKQHVSLCFATEQAARNFLETAEKLAPGKPWKVGTMKTGEDWRNALKVMHAAGVDGILVVSKYRPGKLQDLFQGQINILEHILRIEFPEMFPTDDTTEDGNRRHGTYRFSVN